jgi:hypothetical protein
MTFHVGQKVVCVDACNQTGAWWPLVFGGIYTVRATAIDPLGCSCWAERNRLVLGLAEIGNPRDTVPAIPGGAYDARRFRPAVQPRKELPESITKYLNVPGRVDA